MPVTRLIRSILALGVLAASGCVAPPPQPIGVAGAPSYGTQCVAGFYQCALSAPGQAGAPCSCPGLGAPSYGSIR